MVAEAQKAGGEAAFIDVEHALDPIYAKALGVDIDSLLVSQSLKGGATLFFTILHLVLLPMSSVPFLMASLRRTSIRTEE